MTRMAHAHVQTHMAERRGARGIVIEVFIASILSVRGKKPSMAGFHFVDRRIRRPKAQPRQRRGFPGSTAIASCSGRLVPQSGIPPMPRMLRLLQALLSIADEHDGPVLDELWDARAPADHPHVPAMAQAGLGKVCKVEMIVTAATFADVSATSFQPAVPSPTRPAWFPGQGRCSGESVRLRHGGETTILSLRPAKALCTAGSIS